MLTETTYHKGLVRFRGNISCKPHPQNWFLVPFRGSFQSFRRSARQYYMGCLLPPPPPPIPHQPPTGFHMRTDVIRELYIIRKGELKRKHISVGNGKEDLDLIAVQFLMLLNFTMEFVIRRMLVGCR